MTVAIARRAGSVRRTRPWAAAISPCGAGLCAYMGCLRYYPNKSRLDTSMGSRNRRAGLCAYMGCLCYYPNKSRLDPRRLCRIAVLSTTRRAHRASRLPSVASLRLAPLSATLSPRLASPLCLASLSLSLSLARSLALSLSRARFLSLASARLASRRFASPHSHRSPALASLACSSLALIDSCLARSINERSIIKSTARPVPTAGCSRRYNWPNHTMPMEAASSLVTSSLVASSLVASSLPRARQCQQQHASALWHAWARAGLH